MTSKNKKRAGIVALLLLIGAGIYYYFNVFKKRGVTGGFGDGDGSGPGAADISDYVGPTGTPYTGVGTGGTAPSDTWTPVLNPVVREANQSPDRASMRMGGSGANTSPTVYNRMNTQPGDDVMNFRR